MPPVAHRPFVAWLDEKADLAMDANGGEAEAIIKRKEMQWSDFVPQMKVNADGKLSNLKPAHQTQAMWELYVILGLAVYTCGSCT